jgi:hypothetical protein
VCVLLRRTIPCVAFRGTESDRLQYLVINDKAVLGVYHFYYTDSPIAIPFGRTVL